MGLKSILVECRKLLDSITMIPSLLQPADSLIPVRKVFPQALAYNRLTGAFEEVEARDSSSVSGRWTPYNQQYGATDCEREQMLQWAREERLPLFLSTQLFREFKLCKLLLRPLEDRNSASRGSSRQLRGYSRQSESYVSSLSNGDNTNEMADTEFDWADIHPSMLDRYQRPGSRALSVPAKFLQGFTHPARWNSSTDTRSSKSASRKQSPPKGNLKSSKSGRNIDKKSVRLEDDLEDSSETATSGKGKKKNTGWTRENTTVSFDVSVDQSNDYKFKLKDIGSIKSQPMGATSAIEAEFIKKARTLSAPLNYEDFMGIPSYVDYDMLLGEETEPTGNPYIKFEDEGISETQTENDVRNIEGRLKISFHHLKGEVLGSFPGMHDFKEFLSDTAGDPLVHFWLDCEYFKDVVEEMDESYCSVLRNRLFRDIQDKYKLKLTKDAKDQISKAASNLGLSHTIFIRTQYDVLRRLRTYWVTRFVLHQQRIEALSTSLVEKKRHKLASENENIGASLPFFPSISLVNSMPVRPDDVLSYSTTSNWETVIKGGRRMDNRIKSAKFRGDDFHSKQSKMNKERLVFALTADKIAGGPLQRYLEKYGKKDLLSKLLFWQDVTDYSIAEDRSADRMFRLVNAWGIYNRYLSNGSPDDIGLSQEERDKLHSSLLSAKDFIDSSVFNTAKQHSVEELEKSWIRYLKEDLKIFLDSRVRPGDGSPPSTADVIEVVISDGELMIRRPRPWKKRYPSSEKASLLEEPLDPEQRQELKRLRMERRREMERERKKAIKAAYARVKQQKAKKKKGVTEDELGNEILDDGTLGSEGKTKEIPTFSENQGNKQIMNNFRKYLGNQEDKELAFLLALQADLETYNNLDGKQKKDGQAQYIYKTYLDNQGRRHVTLSDKIASKLNTDKDRPRSATIHDIQKFLAPKLEESFKEYIKFQADDLGMDPKDLASLSQAELAMRLDNSDKTLLAGWNKRGKGKGKPTGRAQPTKDDKVEFLNILHQSASGHITLQLLYFYKYLLKHGEEDNCPLIDKDLFFYLEVQKFKDSSHNHADEELLKMKVQSIVDCFLESITGTPLQIDISPEMLQKTLRFTVRYVNGKEMISTLFDEAQYKVFKDLLPYWAGFKKSFISPEDKKRPVTKRQKLLKKRLDLIENYKIPGKEFSLPAIPEGAVAAYSFSLSDGLKWRELNTDDGSVFGGNEKRDSRSRMTSVESSRFANGLNNKRRTGNTSQASLLIPTLNERQHSFDSRTELPPVKMSEVRN